MQLRYNLILKMNFHNKNIYKINLQFFEKEIFYNLNKLGFKSNIQYKKIKKFKFNY